MKGFQASGQGPAARVGRGADRRWESRAGQTGTVGSRGLRPLGPLPSQVRGGGITVPGGQERPHRTHATEGRPPAGRTGQGLCRGERGPQARATPPCPCRHCARVARQPPPAPQRGGSSPRAAGPAVTRTGRGLRVCNFTERGPAGVLQTWGGRGGPGRSTAPRGQRGAPVAVALLCPRVPPTCSRRGIKYEPRPRALLSLLLPSAPPVSP